MKAVFVAQQKENKETLGVYAKRVICLLYANTSTPLTTLTWGVAHLEAVDASAFCVAQHRLMMSCKATL